MKAVNDSNTMMLQKHAGNIAAILSACLCKCEPHGGNHFGGRPFVGKTHRSLCRRFYNGRSRRLVRELAQNKSDS